MLLLLALAASAQSLSAPNIAGQYVAVTETEYAITLTLAPKGVAKYDFVAWKADDPGPKHHEKITGTWSSSGNLLTLKISSGDIAIYKVLPCLSYREFGEAGCSLGLSLVKTTLAIKYGLSRFGLWNVASLKFGVQP